MMVNYMTNSNNHLNNNNIANVVATVNIDE